MSTKVEIASGCVELQQVLACRGAREIVWGKSGVSVNALINDGYTSGS